MPARPPRAPARPSIPAGAFLAEENDMMNSEEDDLFGGPLWGDEAEERVAGVDEAGRGPLAGPVCAAAVILDPKNPIEGLADSKKLSAKRREALAVEIREKALAWCVAWGEVEEIDRINILQSTMLTMTRAVEGLPVKPTRVIVDGNRAPRMSCPVEAVVKGDQKVPAVSAASILAKTSRDRLVAEYDRLWPGYGFAKHAGYGTAQHLEAIRRNGILPVHRKTFEPIKSMLLEGTGKSE